MGDFDGRSMGAFTDYIPDTKDFPEAPNLEPAADVGLLVETNSGNKTNVTTKSTLSYGISFSKTQRSSFLDSTSHLSHTNTTKAEGTIAGFGIEGRITATPNGNVLGFGAKRSVGPKSLQGSLQGIVRADGLVEGRVTGKARGQTYGLYGNVNVPAAARNASKTTEHLANSASVASHNTYGRFLGAFHSYLNGRIEHKALTGASIFSSSGSKSNSSNGKGFFGGIFGGGGQSKVDGGAGTDTLGTSPWSRNNAVSRQSATNASYTSTSPSEVMTRPSFMDSVRGFLGITDSYNSNLGGAEKTATGSRDTGIGFSGTSFGGWLSSVFGGTSTGDTGTGTGEPDEEPDGGDASKPILLDLNNDGLELNFDRTASFDIDGDGYREGLTWAGRTDGILAVDLQADGSLSGSGDGVINQADEIAFANWGGEGVTDMQALAQARDADDALIFDSNGDGHLNAQDKHWKAMKVFQDLDQDGVSDAGEVQSLEDWGITDISLFYDNGSSFEDHSDDHLFDDGSSISGTSSITQNGVTHEGAAYDMTLGYDQIGFREFQIGGQTLIEFEDGRIVNPETGELIMQGEPYAPGFKHQSAENKPESLEQAAERTSRLNWGMISGAVAAGAVATQIAAQDTGLLNNAEDAQRSDDGSFLNTASSSFDGRSGLGQINTAREGATTPGTSQAVPAQDTANTETPAEPVQARTARADASLSSAPTLDQLTQLQSPLVTEGKGLQESASPQEGTDGTADVHPLSPIGILRQEAAKRTSFGQSDLRTGALASNDPFASQRTTSGPEEMWARIVKQRELDAEAAQNAPTIDDMREQQGEDALNIDTAAEFAATPAAPIEPVEPEISEELAANMAIIRAAAFDSEAYTARITLEFERIQAATELFNAGYKLPKNLTLEMARDMLAEMHGPALSPEDVPQVDPVALELMRMDQTVTALTKPQDQGSIVPRNGEQQASTLGILAQPLG